MAQLYKQEFKTQEKAKYEHIKQAKEKALEEQRVEAEKQAEVDRIAREHDKATEQPNTERAQEVSIEAAPNTETNSIIGSDWSSVSPEQASEYLSNHTGVSADWWLKIAMAESSGNPMALNSIGCFGLYQINQSVHGDFKSATPEQYLNKVIEIYNSQGKMAWEVVSMNGW